MNTLPLSVAPLCEIADKREGTRWAVTGIQVEDLGGRFRATATDTKRLVIVEGPDAVPASRYPESAGLAAAPNTAVKGLVPREVWKAVFAGAKKGTKRFQTVTQCVAVKLGESVATLASTDGAGSSPVSTSGLVEGRFPPVDDVMKTPRKKRGKGAIVVHLDPTLVGDTLKTIGKMMPDGRHVRVEFFDQSKPFLVEGLGESDEKIEAAIMPMAIEQGDADYNPDPTGKRNKLIARLVKARKNLRAEVAFLKRALKDCKAGE